MEHVDGTRATGVRAMKLDLSDYLLLLGAACIVCGVAQINIPAAWITAGVLLIAFSFLIAKEAQNASSEKSISE